MGTNLAVGYDNVCRDLDWAGKPPFDRLEEMSQYVKRLIEKDKPRCVVLCGEYALRAFGYREKPTVAAGLELDPGILGSVHPAYVLRNPGEACYLTAVTNQVKRILSHGPQGPSIVQLDAPDGFERYRTGEKFTFDLETTSLSPRDGHRAILTAAFCNGGVACWFDVNGDRKRWAAVKRYVKKPGHRPIFHHAKFEAAWLDWASLRPRWEDTMLRQHLIDENHSVGLAWLARFLGWPYYWKDIELAHMAELDRRQVGEYNAWDAACGWDVYQHQAQILTVEQVAHLKQCLYPFASVLMRMEESGVYIDADNLRKVQLRCERDSRRLQSVLDEWAGHEVNVRSHQQVLTLLQDRLKLKWPHKTKGGKASTDKGALEFLSPKHPVASKIAHIRALRDKVVRVCIPLAEKRDLLGLVHSHFNLGTVVTGRISSTNPNLQNIDRDGPERLAFRSRFKAGKILQADSSHHELRVLAAYCRDPNLLRIFKQGRDPHQEFADQSGATRQQGKTTNFQVASGGGPNTISKILGCSYQEASGLRDHWYEQYPQAQILHDDIRQEVEERGEVQLWFGRVRHLPHVFSSEEEIRASAVRQALNCPIQATGADVVALWGINVARAFEKYKLRSALILSIHDSLVADVFPGELRVVQRIMKHGLASIDIGVPFVTELKYGDHL